jgi:UDP-2-acetamido-2-deoxy-ribo-hexuluronate aminotransferase
MQFIDLKAQYRRIETEVERRIKAVLEHGQYILGPEVAELEQELAAYAGVRHCIGLSDGTTALQVALMALDIGPGSEVITTPFTFVAPSEMIALVGATPVFVDIDPATYNIDPALIEAAITPRTKAIMPVSLFGQCADLEAINAIAARHHLPVIEDGAQSFGASHKGARSCGLTTIGCTSFFPSKPLGAYGDGGACFTNDDALARTIREVHLHGQDRRYHHSRIGVNGRLDALQAAILLVKLSVFDGEVEQRASIGARYTAALSGLVHTPVVAAGNTSVYAQYTIEVDDRDGFCASLQAQGIPTAVHYPIPLHEQPVFSSLRRPPGGYPCAEAAAARVVSLPMHADLDAGQQDKVIAAVRKTLTR